MDSYTPSKLARALSEEIMKIHGISEAHWPNLLKRNIEMTIDIAVNNNPSLLQEQG